MAVVVADAGPLIALAKINQLSILQSFFNEIMITEAVKVECFANEGLDSERINDAIQQGWIKTVVNPEFITVHSRSLGIGEKTSIEFAIQSQEPVLLIIDDALARKMAHRLNLEVVGIAMLIYKAESRQYLNNADALILSLRKFGYRISDKVIQSVKQQLNIS